MDLMPSSAVAGQNWQAGENEDSLDVLVVPAGRQRPIDEGTGSREPPRLRVASCSALGKTFLIVLVMVIVVTNMRLCGLWSMVAIVAL